MQHKNQAAMTLYTKPDNIKSILHFDTTSRSKIDGDWPSLILVFSDNRRYSLRPLFFAFEDRQNIGRLIVETYKRLASTIKISSQEPVKPVQLWQNTTSIMTDSVNLNLKIGEEVTKDFKSNIPPPTHLLCKSHPVEAFDRSNLTVLAEIESKLDFRKKLQSLNLSVKPFLQGKKSLTECAISSILSLVSHEKSAHSTNQADLFDYILNRENQVNRLAIYHEHRFTKLGYSATSILQSLPFICMLINETPLSNQHVAVVKLLLDSEFIVTELEALSYFTHKVTLPFLHFVEVSSQENLLQVFPELYKDLSSGKMNTLDAYVVHYPHNKVLKPTSDLCSKILNKMCLHAAQVFDRQTGREYGFGNFRLSNPSRATELHLLTNEELAGQPTDNLEYERHLAGFGKRAAVAKFRNKRFTAKGIRNDCTLLISDSFQTKNEKKFNKVVKFLNEMELKWVAEQKKLKLKQIKEKIEKGKKRDQYVQKRLKLCKSWGGPVVSVEELHTILNSHPDKNEAIVRNELIYFRESHKSEVIYKPELLK